MFLLTSFSLLNHSFTISVIASQISGFCSVTSYWFPFPASVRYFLLRMFFFSFHLPLCTFISCLFPSRCNSFPFHFVCPVTFHFSLHFPSQSFIILFPSTLLSIPLSFKLLPFQLSLHLQLIIPTFPTPTCFWLLLIPVLQLPAPLPSALFPRSIHSSPVSFTLLLLLNFCALASSFFLYLPFPFTHFFLHPI